MNMIEIDCFDLQENSIDHFSQWDMDQTIYMKDWECDYIPMFHFSNKKSTEALVVKGVLENDGRISASVPNILLQEHYPLIVYIYLEDDDSSQTVRCIKIPVRKRPKPHDYDYVENIEYINWTKLEKEALDFINELSSSNEQFKSEYESTLGTAKENADKAIGAANSALASELAAKGYADASAESARQAKASEDASRISEGNAKVSEDNAKTSENLAKSYETGASKSATDAQQSANASAVSAQESSNHADRAKESADSVDEKINNKGDNLEFDSETKLLYLTSNGKRVSNGIQIATSGIFATDDDNGNVTIIFG